MSEAFDWYLALMLDEEQTTPKMIVFAESMDHVMDIYDYFDRKLGDSIYCDEGKTVDVFHGSVDPDVERELPEDFKATSESATLHCVITTLAFGMGINIPDIDYVVHWGPPRNVLLYWQEVGRCARDGRQGKAIMCIPPHSHNSKRQEESMYDLVKHSESQCIRKMTLKQLQVQGIEGSDIEKCCHGTQCCSVCDKTVSEKDGE